MSVPNKFGFRLRPGSQRELTALQPSLKRLDLNDSAPCRAASEIPWQRGFKTCVNARACFGSLSIPVNGQCQPPLLFRIAVRGKNTRKFAKHLNSYFFSNCSGLARFFFCFSVSNPVLSRWRRLALAVNRDRKRSERSPGVNAGFKSPLPGNLRCCPTGSAVVQVQSL